MSRISKTAFAFYIEDFKGARDKDVKEIKDIVGFAADDDPYFEGIIIDDDETLEVIIDENTKLILDLIDKTDFSYLGRIGFANKLEFFTTNLGERKEQKTKELNKKKILV